VFADLVLLDCKVLTMNPNQPTGEAVAIKDDRIMKVGSIESVSKTIGKKTKILNLKGKTVIPGIIDTHIHVADFGRLLSWLNLEAAASIYELQNLLKQRVEETSPGKWIVGRGWDEVRFAEKRFPTRFDLDEVAVGNPVALYHQSGQVCVVNSKASELAGITKQPRVGVETNQSEEFTGVLRDEATNLVWKIIPAPTEKEVIQAAGLACQKIIEAGITSIHWIILSPIEVLVIKKLKQQNRLPLRVNVIAPASLFGEISSFKPNWSSEEVKFSSFEIFADGYLAARTAALFKPYTDCPIEKGKLICSQKEMAQMAKKITSAGFQLVIHAVGDKAVDSALNVIEEACNGQSKSGLRCRIEQGAVLNSNLVVRIKKLGVVVSVQPRVVASEFLVWSASQCLGEERASWLFPLKTLVEARVPVVAGSDCPMEPLSPLLGIQEAVIRNHSSPQQRVTVQEALRMYTIDAAYASFEEQIKGSIEKGKLADFTVISDDPTKIKLSKISEITVEATILGGQVIHSRANLI
jgi:predicted amidohydrolase YtcJ